MKKILKLLLFIIILFVVLVGGFMGYIAVSGIPSYEPQEVAFTAAHTPDQVAKGAKLANMVCAHCHRNASSVVLTGRLVEDMDPVFGEIYSQNITQDPTAGIGNWSDGDLALFIKTGLRPDGSYAPPYMPKFPLLSDEDLGAIISYLKSDHEAVQPSAEEAPRSKPSFMTKMLSHIAFKPLPYLDNIPSPDHSSELELGEYLSTAQLGCFHCHSASFQTNNEMEPEKSVGYFGGGNKLFDMEGNEVYSSNITMHEETGIGSYTEEQFINALKFAKKPDGTLLAYPMMPYTQLTDEEAKAIFAYIKTVPVIENKVVVRP